MLKGAPIPGSGLETRSSGICWSTAGTGAPGITPGAGGIAPTEVHAELGAIGAGRKPGRRAGDEIIVFDSTGPALQDGAAAATVYERARQAGRGQPDALGA